MALISYNSLPQITKAAELCVIGKSDCRNDMWKELASHEDFKNDETKNGHFLNSHWSSCMLLLKFHCEINPTAKSHGVWLC